MNAFAYYAPLDPTCPAVERFRASLDDPITEMSGCADEISGAWERRHRAWCLRCQEFGVENIEVVGP